MVSGMRIASARARVENTSEEAVVEASTDPRRAGLFGILSATCPRA
jgi:hypothetical protein